MNSIVDAPTGESLTALFEDKETQEINFEVDYPIYDERKEEVETTLKELGIKKFIVNRRVSSDRTGYEFFEKLTLLMYPKGPWVVEGRKTKGVFEHAGIRALKKYDLIDTPNEEYKQEGCICDYYPTRNLLVVRGNIFANETIWNLFVADTNTINIKEITHEEAENERIKRLWRLTYEKQIERIERSQRETDQNLEYHRKSYIDQLVNRREQADKIAAFKKSKKKFYENQEQLLEELKSMKLVKNLEVYDGIYFDFGTIYLTGDVVTGENDDEEGLDKAIVNTEKVCIGKITFCIKDMNITITNQTVPRGNPHPHSSGGDLCFGEMDLDIHEALAKMDLKRVITMLYSWVHSYNENDCYRTLQFFYNQEHNTQWLDIQDYEEYNY